MVRRLAGLSGGLPGLRVVGGVVRAAGGAAGASCGGPGQERVEFAAGEGFAAVFGAGGEVVSEQVQWLGVVLGGGGGDGPDAGGQAGGPGGAGAVEVLASDDGSAQRPLGTVVVVIRNSA